MVTKGVLLLAALVTLGLATTCPIYTCDSTLASNVCASWTSGNNFKLNSNGCQSNYYCSELATDLWAQLKVSLGGDNTLTCTASSTTSTSTTTSTTWTSMPCYTKQANKNFKSGAAVVTCTSNSDCLLIDGSKTTCSCAFRGDGAGICDPDTSNDQAFSGYWNLCGTSNTITNANAYVYYTFYMTFWVYEQSTVGCTSIFLEKQTLNTLYSAYNGSAALAVGGFGLAALLY